MSRSPAKRARSGGSQPANKKGIEPDGSIRASQLITTYGPGSLVDLLHDAVVVGGLEHWRYQDGYRVIHEPRLAEYLKKADINLDPGAPFREPPSGDAKDPNPGQGINAMELPRWFVCRNSRCRALTRSDALERKDHRYQHDCDDRPRENPGCVPVRFLAACRRGHVDDFPWRDFVHAHAERRCTTTRLSLDEGKTGDFAEVRIACACGARRRLVDASAQKGNPQCSGMRPWLGRDAQEPCEERIHLLVRTASNGYFAQFASATTLPDPENELRDLVQKHWGILSAATPQTLPFFRAIPTIQQELPGFTDAEVLATVAELMDGKPAARESLRVEEFRQLSDAKLEAAHESPGPETVFFPRRYQPKKGLPRGIGRLVLVKKLREVRAQVSFTRIELPSPAVDEELDLDVARAPLSLDARWLPATVMLGEGLFIELDPERLAAWEQRPAVRQRAEALLAGYEQWIKQRELVAGHELSKVLFPGPRFYLIHSLSHMLMSALALDCGYPASALKERLYSSRPNEQPAMAAFLISTGSSGSAGTLGGLVEEGRRLDVHLARALDSGRLCSNDPVCAAHTPRGDLSERHLEGSACHGCLFMAECSCERNNQFLDRALVTPTIGHPGVAFFDEPLR